MGTLRDLYPDYFHRYLRLDDAQTIPIRISGSKNESDVHNDRMGLEDLTRCSVGCEGQVQDFGGERNVR